MKPVATLFCLADEAGFRLLLGRGREIEEIQSASADAFEDVDYEFAKGGRNRSGGVSFGHDTRSEAEIERPRLARHVVRALQDEWAKGKADRIVLAAGPKMLGALRDALPAALAPHVAAELAKDLSDIPARDLAGHLPDLPNV
ncbi:host attachment protein [Tabrizicola flagellatus]|uniref:host attachment protein n=1 Tax=Tabrizicola flagellatus TaxID=2593021 RepID=UPI0013587EC3|nr:host attachment protein [Tabrizicola flagellatus]